MQRIQVLRNLARDLPPYKEGQVCEVSDSEGQKLCSMTLAILLEQIPESVTTQVVEMVAEVAKTANEPEAKATEPPVVTTEEKPATKVNDSKSPPTRSPNGRQSGK